MTSIDHRLECVVDALKWAPDTSAATITLARPQPHAVKVVELVGFDKIFEITA